MKVIERKLRASFWDDSDTRKNCYISNSRVTHYTDSVELRLFGNLIAYRFRAYPDIVCITMAGWPTVTTRSRLNNVVLNDMGISQRAGMQFLGDTHINAFSHYMLKGSQILRAQRCATFSPQCCEI